MSRELHRKRLTALVQVMTGVTLSERQLSERVAQMLRDSKRGRLDHHDSLILGALTEACLRDCQ